MKYSKGPWYPSPWDRSPRLIHAADNDGIIQVYLTHPKTKRRDDEHLGNFKLALNAARMYELLSESLVAWEGEEDSVKEEHAELIRVTRKFLEEIES